jgi:hypothetical protein
MGTPSFSDTIWQWIANHLPKRLVYFCGYRIWLHGTWGEYSDTDVPSLLMTDALKRWNMQ